MISNNVNTQCLAFWTSLRLAFWVTWSILSAVESITWGAIWLIPFFTELKFGLVAQPSDSLRLS